MKTLDTESKISFDRSIGTEDRFTLRRWFEKFVHACNQSNPAIWDEYLDGNVVVSGFTDAPMNFPAYKMYLINSFKGGSYVGRYPRLEATCRNNLFVLSGMFESFIDGILTCSGDITVEIVKDPSDVFKLQRLELSPRFRVQK